MISPTTWGALSLRAIRPKNLAAINMIARSRKNRYIMIEPPFQHGIADMAFWFIQWYLPSAQPPQPKGAGAVFPYVLPRCSYFFKSFVTEMSIFICMHKCLAQTGRLRGSSCHIVVAAKSACACTLLWISDHFYKKLLPYVLFFFFKIYLKKIDFFQNIA